jgi:HK97 family phage major capsid protein
MSKVLEAALPELSTLAGDQIDNVQELQALITRAKKSKKADEIIAEMKKDFSEELTGLNTTVAAMREEMKNRDEEFQTKMAENANLKTLFANGNTEQKKELWEMASKEFGGAAAELAIFGNSIEKCLYGKVARDSNSYEIASKMRAVSDTALALVALNKESGQNGEAPPTAFKAALEFMEKRGFEGVETFRKTAAYDTQTTGEGKEFIPVDLSQTLIEAIFLPLRVAPMIQRITMTTPTFEMPQITSRGRAYLMSESLTPADFYSNPSTPDGFATAKMQFNAKKLGASLFMNDEIMEDSKIPLAQRILQEISIALSVSIEDALINGNRTAWNSGLDNAAAAKLWASQNDARYAWDGIRYNVAAGQQVNTAGTMNLLALRKGRRVMGKYGVNPADLAWVFNPVTFPDILGIDEVIRWRDIRDRGTVMTGILAEIDGIGITLSEYIYNNVNASGVYDGVTTTKTMGLLFTPGAYAFGDRRKVMVETDRQILSQQRAVIGTWRGDVQKLRKGMNTTEEALLVNLPN